MSDENVPPKAVVLVGLKHCGKSSAGKILADTLGCAFYDTDSLIESLTGKTARALFVEGGASLMAQKEAEACTEALRLCARDTENADGTDGGFRAVISTGGAFCENPAAVGILRRAGILCYIEANCRTLYDRILRSAKRDGEMPAYLRGENPEAAFREIHAARSEKYRRMADITVTTDNEHEAAHTAGMILRALKA